IALMNLGSTYTNEGDFKTAKKYYEDALLIRRSQNDKVEEAKINNFLAVNDFLANRNENALDYVDKAIADAEKELGGNNKLKAQEVLMSSYQIKANIFQQQNDLTQYQRNYQKYLDLQKAYQEEQNRQRQELIEKQLELEKKESEFKSDLAEKEKKELELTQTRLEKEKAQNEALQVIEENARIIMEQNEMLENKVNERTRELQQKQEEIMVQNEELYQQREEIMAQRDFIERKNKELTELNTHMSQSIQYASSIQRAILPKEEDIKASVRDFFVLYLPKDIVSGDFYWYSKIANKQFFAAVDCTGHGVPGAFMSMIGNTLLNKIINESKIFDPAQILEKLNEGVISSLKQQETGNSDGMDVCLCCIETIVEDEEYLVSYGGARRPLFIFSDNQIIELKGSRNHIGGSSIGINQSPFETYTYKLKKGDAVYLSTDGYVDNPNPQREKFGNDKFKTLLLLYGSEPMDRQKHFLLEELKSFQKDTPQRDDILVMGVRV
ncbi:MAG: SpoIIE family protein phosphatase, partial [Raineya sp.]